MPALYLGLEAGYANPDGDDVELTYVPLELNLKYAVPTSPNFVVDFGAGASYNYAEFENGGSADAAANLKETFRESDWVFGGQFFVDANYTSGSFFVGINGKYQLTEEFEDSDISLDNWRVGGQIGIMF